MKKKIALLILLALALTIVFAACNKTEATSTIPRWSADGESYEYVISLADFATEGSSSHFQAHDYNGESYYKDFDIRTGEPLNDLDEIRPESVIGTFKIDIKTYKINQISYDRVETTQFLKATYDNKDNKLNLSKDLLNELKNKGILESDADGKITLVSATITTVDFKRNEKQSPIKSSTSVDGFYMGKAHQEYSNYEITTEYDYSGKHAVAKIKLTNNGETKVDQSFTLKRYTEGSFIDSNQLFMYTRSFDKSSTSFQDSPSVAVYNPFNQTMQTASFSKTDEANAILTDSTRGELYTKLPTVGVVVGGLPFMLQECVPNLLDKSDGNGDPIDSAYYGIVPYAKHTPVRFRVGYLSFELKEYNETIWNALGGATTETED